MPTYLRAHWTWLPPLAALLLYGAVWLSDGNRTLFLVLNHAGHALGKDFWASLTIMGDGAVALSLVLPLIRKSPQRFWAALLAALIVTIGIQVCKHMMPLPRPLATLAAHEFFHHGPRLRALSFPSGHSAAIFTLAGTWTIGLAGRHLWRSVIFLLAALVALSRIMVGVHWPLDVLAGMCGGWMAAGIGLWLSNRWQWKTTGIAGLLAGSALLAIAASLLFSKHTGFHGALGWQRLLGLACFACGMREMAAMHSARLFRLPFLRKRVVEPEA